MKYLFLAVILTFLILAGFWVQTQVVRATAITLQVMGGNDDVARRGNSAGECIVIEPFQSTLTGNKDSGPANLKVGSGGFRFVNVAIPRGAIIESAIWQGYQTREGRGAPTFKIQGEAAFSASTFNGTCADWDSRPKTNAVVDWSPPQDQDQWHSSPDLKTIIQEIVNQSKWGSGNSLVIFIQWNGIDAAGNYRTWKSYEDDPNYAPKLQISYVVGEPITATAETDTHWVKGGATGKNVVLTINNSSGSTESIHWVKITHPSPNYTLTGGSATGWQTYMYGGSYMIFSGGSIDIGSSGAFTVTLNSASQDENQLPWQVSVDDDLSGSSPTNAASVSSGALDTGIDSTAPTNAGIASVSADSYAQLTANAQVAADSGSGLNVEPYWFDETTGGPGASDSSAWQSQTAFADAGLSAATQYCYRVKARDAVSNESSFSAPVCQTTLPGTVIDNTSPAAVSNLAAGNPSGSSVDLTWTAPGDDGNTGTASSYDVRYSTGAITDDNWNATTPALGEPAPASAGSSETFTVTGLAQNTLYYFALKTSDEVSNISGLSNIVSAATLQAVDATAPAISLVTTSNITGSSVLIVWLTDEAATSQVEYGAATGYGQQSGLDTALVISHSAGLTGLSSNTVYNYRVKSKDASGNLAVSGNFTFTTRSEAFLDVIAPTFSEIAAATTYATSTITWKTNEPATSLVEYGKTLYYGSQTPEDRSLVTAHKVVIGGLEPETSYYFRLISKDFFGNNAVSGDSRFTTLSEPLAPKIFDIQAADVKNSSAKIIWKTDIPATSRVLFGTESGKLVQDTGEFVTLVSDHSVSLSNLSPGTKYFFMVISQSSENRESRSEEQSFQTTALEKPPQPVITDLKVLSVHLTSAQIAWNTDIPATSQILFGIKSGELSQTTMELMTLVSQHAVTISDLSPDTTYLFVVVSRSAQGIEARSEEHSLRTESVEIQTVVDVKKLLALPPGSPGTQVPKMAVGETVTAVPISETPDDAQPPEITFFDFSENPTENTSPVIRGQALDKKGVIAGISYSTDGGASWHPITEVSGIGSSSAKFSAKIPNLSDGNYPILFRVRDNSGNIEKSKVKILIVDVLPPATGANIMMLGTQSLLPSSAGTFSTLTGIAQRLVISSIGGAVSLEVLAKKISGDAQDPASAGELIAPLTYSKSADLWFGDIAFEKPGNYQLQVRAIDGTDQVSLRAINPISVSEAGRVVDFKTKTGIDNAWITVFQFFPELDDFVPWPGEVFNQANPQVTRLDGTYRFILPPGKYYLKVEKEGYRTFYTDIMNLDSHEAINFVIPITSRPIISLPFAIFGISKIRIPVLPDFFGMNRVIQSSQPVIPVLEEIAKLIGNPAPIFALPDAAGEPFDIRYLRGKKAVVSVWSSWSPMAQIQIPILDEFQKSREEDVQVLLLSIQESGGVAQTYLHRGGYQIPTVIDRHGEITRLYPILTLPQHFFLDRKGILREIYIGLVDAERLSKIMEEL